YHPHTNMAKAALNMMTRTSASDYAKDNIFMNSVDTGWITNENPYPKKMRIQVTQNFYTPLDAIDGMARIYDPIVQGIENPETPIYGHFLKDYAPYPW
ncbi:MAG TPA: short-chain dehydrogenase, partial [Cyanobacteria bacterium UBA11369]|nr:short-chain dehydrogenase [Cyanobacteria bacterium UBA11369]